MKMLSFQVGKKILVYFCRGALKGLYENYCGGTVTVKLLQCNKLCDIPTTSRIQSTYSNKAGDNQLILSHTSHHFPVINDNRIIHSPSASLS